MGKPYIVRMVFEIAAGMMLGAANIFCWGCGLYLMRRSPPLPPPEYNRAIVVNKLFAVLFLFIALAMSMQIFSAAL